MSVRELQVPLSVCYTVMGSFLIDSPWTVALGKGSVPKGFITAGL